MSAVRAFGSAWLVCAAALFGCTDRGTVGASSPCGNPCSSGRMCDAKLALCVECSAERDCAGGEHGARVHCDAATHACVECRTTTDCTPEFACVAGACMHADDDLGSAGSSSGSAGSSSGGAGRSDDDHSGSDDHGEAGTGI